MDQQLCNDTSCGEGRPSRYRHRVIFFGKVAEFWARLQAEAEWKKERKSTATHSKSKLPKGQNHRLVSSDGQISWVLCQISGLWIDFRHRDLWSDEESCKFENWVLIWSCASIRFPRVAGTKQPHSSHAKVSFPPFMALFGAPALPSRADPG